MADERTTLHMLCGKMAAGKSTLAARLAEAPATILISEDDWLAILYPGELVTIDDYSRRAGRLCEAIGPLIVELLRTGVSVVLDFHANTLARRAWLRALAEGAGVRHQLHYLRVSDETCKARLRARNAAGTHHYQPDDAVFDLFTRYFVPPSVEEGLNVVVHEDRQD